VRPEINFLIFENIVVNLDKKVVILLLLSTERGVEHPGGLEDRQFGLAARSFKKASRPFADFGKEQDLRRVFSFTNKEIENRK
jgi:hypothetical protein